MTTGGYGALLRTGDARGTYLELILRSLLAARGTAITAEEGTVAWVESMAIARALFTASETVRRLKLQFDPNTATALLERWEAILGIVPGAELTFNERRRLVAAKWALVGSSPVSQVVIDLLDAVIGSIFVRLIRIPSDEAFMRVPGGLTVTGGNTVPDGDWVSSVSFLPVHVSQPLTMTTNEFINTVALFLPFFYDIMPSYTTYDWGTFGAQTGTVSISAGSTTLVGTGTLFLTNPTEPLQPGDEIEVRDVNGDLLILIVDSVTSDTELEVTVAPTTSVVDSYWALFGFYLDADRNLDHHFLT